MEPTVIISLVTSIINRVWPDKTEQQKLEFARELQTAILDANLASSQIDVNKAEAQSDKLFVSGWRPFIGWVCGAAFSWEYCFKPLLVFLLVASGHPVPVLPELGLTEMMPVLMGILGLGGLRTYEKIKKKIG